LFVSFQDFDNLSVTTFSNNLFYEEEEDDVPPGSQLTNSYSEQLSNYGFYYIYVWKISHFITINGMNQLKWGLNWKSKVYILCFQNNLDVKCIKCCYQHVDEPNIVDIFFFNTQTKQIFKRILTKYLLKYSPLITIL